MQGRPAADEARVRELYGHLRLVDGFLARQRALVETGTHDPEVREIIARLRRMRQRLLRGMAEAGLAEGRWTRHGPSGLFLERTLGPDGPWYELHEVPWPVGREAPSGEDPRHALRRAELCGRAAWRRRETALLLLLPAASGWLAGGFLAPGQALLLVPPVFALLLRLLPLGRERLLALAPGGGRAAHRIREERAAIARLRFSRHAKPRPPEGSLLELPAEPATGPHPGANDPAQITETRREA